MAVHYKFNAAKEYDTLPVDGLHISLADLKEAIIHHKRLGKGDLCDLQVTNAETKETYSDDKALIPKNSSLIIARVPIDPSQKKNWDLSRDDKELLLSNPEYRMNTEGAEEANQLSRKLEEVPDLTKFVGTEEEKISAMIAQSTLDYHPSRYLKLRNTVMSGKVPPFYKCYKCHQGGHWVTNCPLNNQDLRKSTGIPSKFLIEVTDPNTPGVMITGVGKYVVFRQNLVMGEGTQAKVRPKCSENPPEELVCLLCKEMMQDAVLTPCCANAFCDDCLRNHLLDSDDHACPSCHQTGIGPDTLVPNRYLRLKILQFGNQFLTELPDENVNGRSDSPSSLFPKSRSYPGTPVVVMSPADSPGITKTDSPQPSVDNMKNSPRSPPILSDLRIMEEEEERKKEINKKDNDAATECEESERATVEETKRKKRSEEGEGKMEGLSQESLMTSPGSQIHEELESGLIKSRKHGKKNKKKKDGEGKEKHKKKDKEKKKSKKKKESKEGTSEVEGDGLLNTSHDEGSEKVSDPLMNEAICPTFDPSIPPPGTMPVRPPRPPPRYPVNTMIPVLGAPYQPAIQPFVIHAGRYGIQSQDDDPVKTFMRYLEKKDEQKRKRFRSKSSSRSPYRDRSRPRLQPVNSYSRSRSRSVSKARSPSWSRKHHSGNSPRSRRRCSRSPTSNSRHGFRSVSRERSPSLSRSPSPGRRMMSSPLASGHLYSSYSPHRAEMEKTREKKSFMAATACASDFGHYNYNAMYDCPVSIGGYVARASGEKGPLRDNRRHHRHYGYEVDMEMNPQLIPFKDDPRRGVSRRLIDDRRAFDDRPRSREDDWRRHRGLEEEEWNRRNPYSKGDHRHRYDSRNRISPVETHRGRGKEYENPKEQPPLDSKHHRRDRRREIGEGHHSVSKSGSLSPSSHREERKRERKDRGMKGSRERAPEDERRITEMKRTKEKSHIGKMKISDEERTESVEKDRIGRGERPTGTRWGEDKVSAKESDPVSMKEIRSNTPPVHTPTESTAEKEEKGRKKHEKKKKKKEKRRSSQASQEEGCPSNPTIEDDKKTRKKEKEKKREKKVTGVEETTKESTSPGCRQSENRVQKEPPEPEEIQPIGKAADTAEEFGTDAEAAFLPALSKWEREDEVVLSPSKASVDLEKKVEESLVTSDVIKRAENALFSKGLTNRALMPRKVYLEKSSRERERELQQEAQRSPTPEWDRADTREAKRKGGSIQITISSKTESQIGRPRFGKLDILKDTTSPTIDDLSITKVPEADNSVHILENKGNVSRWNSAISPKRKEHVTLDAVKVKKLRIDAKDRQPDMKDCPKNLEKRPVNIATEEANCSASSRESRDNKQGHSIGQNDEFERDIRHSSTTLPHSPLRRGDSQEQVVSSTEEMRLPIEGQNSTFCSAIESRGQSVSAHLDEALKLPTLPEALPLIEGLDSREKAESDIEEGELVEEQPSEAVPDSTEDQLGREVHPYLDANPISLVKELLDPSQDECGLPSKEMVLESRELCPGQEGSFLPSLPSPTIKRKGNEGTLGDKKPKKKKKRKHSSSSSTSTSSSSSSSSDSTSEEESLKKKKKKKKRKKKKAAVDSDSSDENDPIKDKRKKKKKKKKKRKAEKSLEKAKSQISWMQKECV